MPARSAGKKSDVSVLKNFQNSLACAIFSCYIITETRSAESTPYILFWRIMENTGRLKELIQTVLDECGVLLYEIRWTGGKEKTLEVSIMKEDGSMDLDTCASVSEKLSEALDESDVIRDAYVLDVCSPGAEREIRDINELKKMDQPYVLVRLAHPYRKMQEITGTVLSFEDGIIRIEYRDKAAVRTAEISSDEITFARLAVKF